MAEVTLFHKRFGGSISLAQELADMTSEFPFWARPFWKWFVIWLAPKIQETQLQRTMNSVDRQAKEIGDQWQKEERERVVLAAVEQAKLEHPTAKVEVVKMPHHPVDAVYIEKPPEPGNQAQEALGFGSIEIRAPWVR